MKNLTKGTYQRWKFIWLDKGKVRRSVSPPKDWQVDHAHVPYSLWSQPDEVIKRYMRKTGTFSGMNPVGGIGMKNPTSSTDPVKLAMTGLIGDRRKTISGTKLYARVYDQSRRLGVYPPSWSSFVDQVRAHGGRFSSKHPFKVSLPQRRLLNPGAAWHKGQYYETLRKGEDFPKGDKYGEGYVRGAMAAHKKAASVSSRLGMPNPKRRNPRKQVKGTYMGTLLAIGTIVGVAWLAKKYKEQEV